VEEGTPNRHQGPTEGPQVEAVAADTDANVAPAQEPTPLSTAAGQLASARLIERQIGLDTPEVTAPDMRETVPARTGLVSNRYKNGSDTIEK
jgi:hypothetical protein